MSVISVQTVIARLCVDAIFREAFLQDPDAALRPFGLTAGEAVNVRDLDMEAVRSYAGGLLSKRLKLMAKWLPVCFAVLHGPESPKGHRFLERYARENIRDDSELGGEWLRRESRRFADYLRQRVFSGEIPLPALAELAEFEAVKFSMMNDPEVSHSALAFAAALEARPAPLDRSALMEKRPLRGRHVHIQAFGYDIPDLVEGVEAGRGIADAEPTPTWVLFFKGAGKKRVATSILNEPPKDLLDLCDGQATGKQIVAHIVARHGASWGLGPEQVTEECLDALSQFHAAGAIDFLGAEARGESGSE